MTPRSAAKKSKPAPHIRIKSNVSITSVGETNKGRKSFADGGQPAAEIVEIVPISPAAIGRQVSSKKYDSTLFLPHERTSEVTLNEDLFDLMKYSR